MELSKASLAKYKSESKERMLSAARGNMKWDVEESKLSSKFSFVKGASVFCNGDCYFWQDISDDL